MVHFLASQVLLVAHLLTSDCHKRGSFIPDASGDVTFYL